jgi:hypothetical protein
LEAFVKTCRENTNLFKIGQKYRALYLKTYGHILAGAINSPLNDFLRVKCYKVVGIAGQVLALQNILWLDVSIKERALLRLHGKAFKFIFTLTSFLPSEAKTLS